jgi:molybdopterin synthase catalytic subunit/molybdopterin converting factor small subunit
MRVRVVYLGALREQVGLASEVLGLPEASEVSHVLDCCCTKYPSLKPWLKSLAVALNQEYASPGAKLKDGDELALLPPVSGGTARAKIVQTPIETQRVLALLKQPEDGALVVFEGVVRNNSRGRRTLYLEYEAYEEMALRKMEALAAEAIAQKKARDVAIIHRLGRLEVGETSVLIVVASDHRAAAFDACRWLIDTLKQTVPIWKKEYFEDGAVWAAGDSFPAEIPRVGDTNS